MLCAVVFFVRKLSVIRIGFKEVVSGVINKADAVERMVAMLESIEFDSSGLLAFSFVNKFAFSAGDPTATFRVKSLEFLAADNLKLKPPDGVSTVLDVSALLEAFVVDNLHVVRAVEAADDEKSEVVTALKLF